MFWFIGYFIGAVLALICIKTRPPLAANYDGVLFGKGFRTAQRFYSKPVVFVLVWTTLLLLVFGPLLLK